MYIAWQDSCFKLLCTSSDREAHQAEAISQTLKQRSATDVNKRRSQRPGVNTCGCNSIRTATAPAPQSLHIIANRALCYRQITTHRTTYTEASTATKIEAIAPAICQSDCFANTNQHHWMAGKLMTYILDLVKAAVDSDSWASVKIQPWRVAMFT